MGWRVYCAAGKIAGMALLAGSAGAQNIDLSSAATNVAVHYVSSKPNSVPSQTVAPAGDFNGDGFGDFIVGSPLATNNLGYSSGHVYLCLGKASPYNFNFNAFNSTNEQGFRISSSESGDLVGYSVAGLGDINGDGLDDFAAAGWGRSAYVVYGTTGTLANLTVGAISSASGKGVNIEGVRFGSSGAGTYTVGSAGDVNGDGYSDLMVAASAGTEGTSSTRAGVHVIFGKPALQDMHLANFVSSDETGFFVNSTNSRSRGMYPAGDFNNDGYDDVLVPYNDLSAHVVFGKPSDHADVPLSYSGTTTGTLRIDTTNTSAPSIQCLAGAGDFNGDGYSDVMVGLGRLTAYVIYGGSTGTDTSSTLYLKDLDVAGPSGFRIDLPSQASWSWMNFAGDVNNDGFDDIMLTDSSASYNGLARSGSTFVVYGRATVEESMDLSMQFEAGTDGFRVDGRYADPATIPIISTAGDVNADGFADMLIDQCRFVSGQQVGNTAVVFGSASAVSSIEDWQLFQ